MHKPQNQHPDISSSSSTNSISLGDRHHVDFRAASFSSLFDAISNRSTHSKRSGKWKWSGCRTKGLSLALCLFLGFFFLVTLAMLSMIQADRILFRGRNSVSHSSSFSRNSSPSPMEESITLETTKKPRKNTLERLLALAAHSLAEKKREPKDLWVEPYAAAAAWKPCSDQRSWEPNSGSNGYIMITANGGINQQRVAVCNAVVLARALNSTLVIPTFMYSTVWKDPSQFGDIYNEDYFIDVLSRDVRIVKNLPDDLKSVDLEAVGSVLTDEVVEKEASLSYYLKNIPPILSKNKVVHFMGFANRLAFDHIPFELQRLRCRCNFHALQFAHKIQRTGALLLQRLRNSSEGNDLISNLLGAYTPRSGKVSPGDKYLAIHLRFEIDMVAHSLCEYGGGEEERKELQSYRNIHFPGLSDKQASPGDLRMDGLCPLSPEETVLMLAALGFSKKTRIYVAGADVYGGASRLSALKTLYPHLVTKEKLLSGDELASFANRSSQMAALDFIGCAGADVFAMTDPGSQLSSLVNGYRIYYGGGKMTTVRPNKRRLADIFLRNNTIGWRVFEQRIQKAVRQTKHVFQRPKKRSVFRYPRCKECMCFD